jgi:hypothetical protein
MKQIMPILERGNGLELTRVRLPTSRLRGGDALGLSKGSKRFPSVHSLEKEEHAIRRSGLLVVLVTFGLTVLGALGVALAAPGSTNGAAGQMPAYYDGRLFTINLLELSDTAAASIIGKNPSVNTIYASNDLDEEQDFIPVINAIQGDGFNPLWQQVLIVFNAGFTPHQFFSDEEIEAAAAGDNPEIHLVETDEVYRCAVVGRK